MKELKFIQAIQKSIGKPGKGVVKGIGDDCAVLDFNKHEYLIWSTDMLIEGTHFTRRSASFREIGHKAATVNISDIAAMGGTPKYMTVSLGLPRSVDLSERKHLYSGLKKVAGKYGVQIIGGDTNASDHIVVSVSIIGNVSKKCLVMRSGARSGDVIIVTGPIRNGKKEHLKLLPRVEESGLLVKRYRPNAMIDVSDGIAMDIHRICEASGTGCRIHREFLPVSNGLKADDALFYGESFEIMCTMSKTSAQKLRKDMAEGRIKHRFYDIGEIVGKSKGVKLIKSDGRPVALPAKGYRHM